MTRPGIIGLIGAIAWAAPSCGHNRSASTAAGDVALRSENGINIYALTGANMLAPAAAAARPLVYVPNSRGASVTVIDPKTYAVVRTFRTGELPQHVVPAYDLDTLWVANNKSNTLTPIDPRTGEPGKQVRVDDPYNMYFTPDGQFALVIAERRLRLDFRGAHDKKLVQSIPTNCRGIDHVEFTADGRYAIATCEFSGQLMKLDLTTRAVVGYLKVDSNHVSMPQDIRSSADGQTFFAADMTAGGVWVIDPVAFKRIGFIRTGRGAHGIYPSRDGRMLYVTNRGWSTLAAGRRGPGSISVLDPEKREVFATWSVPNGGSPDMGNVTATSRPLRASP